MGPTSFLKKLKRLQTTKKGCQDSRESYTIHERGLVSVAGAGHHVKESVAQDDLVSSMKEAAANELLPVSHDHHSYKRLLKDLMVQVVGWDWKDKLKSGDRKAQDGTGDLQRQKEQEKRGRGEGEGE
ncbi:hypothetical protein Sjap_007921 [Stephania japonica]|uniref:Uncharacterized protein n=1 Tax=Stephania japonica TaxID=461633 RepID=A0AAP0JQV9_9MAGN